MLYLMHKIRYNYIFFALISQGFIMDCVPKCRKSDFSDRFSAWLVLLLIQFHRKRTSNITFDVHIGA